MLYYLPILLVLSLNFRLTKSLISIQKIKSAIAKQTDKENIERYIVRDVKYADLPNIRNCNERNMPESYDGNFYSDQMVHWPQLSLALCMKAVGDVKSSKDGGVNEIIIGYALVRTTDLLKSFEGQYDNRRAVVISVAVDLQHRGRGLAQTLLHAMHTKISLHYPDINIVELNCRVSNEKAIRTYETLQYKRTHEDQAYYLCGENALRMEFHLDGKDQVVDT